MFTPEFAAHEIVVEGINGYFHLLNEQDDEVTTYCRLPTRDWRRYVSPSYERAEVAKLCTTCTLEAIRGRKY